MAMLGWNSHKHYQTSCRTLLGNIILSMVDLCFIIVNWNTRQLLLDCIDSIYTTVIGFNYQIYVVDNGSVDDSVKAVRERFPQVIVIENQENKGFAVAVNQALGKDATTYSVLINTDTLLHKNAIRVMHSFMEQHKDVGIVGSQLEKPDGTRQHSYDNYPTLATELFNKSLLQWLFPYRYPSKKQSIVQPMEVESVIGACMMIRNEAIKNVGKLDEDYFFFSRKPTGVTVCKRRAGRCIMYLKPGSFTLVDKARKWRRGNHR